MKAWYWNDVMPRPGALQMAIDRAWADDPATVIFRLYRWDRATVSLGANEAALRTWNRDALANHAIDVVRRPTGGRGVWHDPADLTYAVTGARTALGDLRQAYHAMHEILANALRHAGFPAEMAPATRRPTLAPGACFDLTVGGEVLLEGRKMIGSAQAVIGTALLQHGAIALADRQPMLARFRLDSRDIAAPEAPPSLAPDPIADAIVAGWSAWGAEPIPDSATARALREAERWRAHFEDAGWTWRR